MPVIQRSAARKRLEHSLCIQAAIEGLSPQQVLIRDELIKEHGLTFADATAVVKSEKRLEDALAQRPAA